MEEFDLKDFIKYYFSMIMLVVVITSVAVVTMVCYQLFIQVPKYESHTTLVLASSQTITQNDLSINKNLVSTYREIIKSRRILSQVINNLDLDITYENLKSIISVTSVSDTELIDLGVTYTDAETAKDIANEIAKVFIKEVPSIYNIENVSVVDVAIANNIPSNIHILKQYALAIIAGIALSSSIIFAMFSLDDTIKRKKDIEEKVELSVLATVPSYEGKISGNELIVDKDPKSVASETFRTLRTNLKFLSVDKKNQTILITSTVASEGKSFVAANLAIALAQAGEKVLLVDCDLRKGRQHRIFNGSSTLGFSDLLSDPDADDLTSDTIRRYLNKTKVKNLTVLFRGSISPNPAELLGSEKNKRIIKRLKGWFSIIIFDSAPINGSLSDSIIMSNLVDGTMVVAASKVTPLHLLKETKNQLVKSNSNILGVVLNKSDSRNDKYYGKYGN